MTSFLCTLENLQGSFHENRELLPITLSLGNKNQVRNTFYAVEQMIRINKTIFLFFHLKISLFNTLLAGPGIKEKASLSQATFITILAYMICKRMGGNI